MRALVVMSASDLERDEEIMSRRWPRLLAAIGAHDVDVRVTTLRRAPNLRRAFGEAGVPATSLEARSVAASFAAIPRLARRLREGDVDLVHSAEPVPAVVTGIAARLTRDRPTLVYSRHHTGGRRQLRVASRIAAALSDWTLVACETSRQEAIVTDHTPPARVVVAESGVVEHRTVSEHETSALRRRLGVPEGDAIVVVLARLRPEKGVDVAIDAQRVLDATSGRTTHLVVVGAGPEEAALRLHATDVPRVHFVGHQSDVALWLAVADVCAMPSRRETFGQVTVEVMAAGRPLVASAVDGLRDAVADGVTGVLVPPDDPSALAAAVRGLLSDDARRAALGAAAFEHFRARFTLERMAEGWLVVWRRALGRTDIAADR